eukprot:CAMPEP_0171773304 /NCGR_PEP_ID=MMETSP0991-20121206/55209_1 /TAXON_ID=483369 /ORGANISM="non described non described, Strain CCMP2098" /LENGTH=116 /DNA_ID=CAMNT_0012379007 /DNA_START=763 /DNA_END=1113 /DNA_ORIENTATION=+
MVSGSSFLDDSEPSRNCKINTDPRAAAADTSFSSLSLPTAPRYMTSPSATNTVGAVALKDVGRVVANVVSSFKKSKVTFTTLQCDTGDPKHAVKISCFFELITSMSTSNDPVLNAV